LVDHIKEEEMDGTLDPTGQVTKSIQFYAENFGALRVIIYITTPTVARQYSFECKDNVLI
jgi:hypothetical protein